MTAPDPLWHMRCAVALAKNLLFHTFHTGGLGQDTARCIGRHLSNGKPHDVQSSGGKRLTPPEQVSSVVLATWLLKPATPTAALLRAALNLVKFAELLVCHY